MTVGGAAAAPAVGHWPMRIDWSGLIYQTLVAL